ncbi:MULTISPECIES: hypothetical protein [Klebsiella]|uniref:hypothetical protein n=1 Tax=Klebsiella TaxID=570 RepID=UPI001953AAED|nr:hypothetical protein [Klebsiella michiganensis]
MNSFYYPILVRQDISIYCKGDGGFYATYNCDNNYKNIAKDCQFRCVYCDVHVDECGGEHFSLDHFRPMDVFLDKFEGVLKIHPFNLHLSCQKCNVLKTNDWKGCENTMDGVTYISRLGYVDRFKEDINKYIKVDEDGCVVSIDNNGPGDYMIRKMLLNRTNRVYIRKRRVVKEKASRIFKMLLQKQTDILSSNDQNVERLKKEIQKIQGLLRRFERLNLLKL